MATLGRLRSGGTGESCCLSVLPGRLRAFGSLHVVCKQKPPWNVGQGGFSVLRVSQFGDQPVEPLR